MLEKNRFTKLYQSLFKDNADDRDKKHFAYWFAQLDLSGGKIFDSEDEMEQIRSRMAANLQKHTMAKNNSHIRPLWQRLTVAAGLLIVISALAITLLQSRQTSLSTITYNSYTTKAGERRIITLPDGSAITINNQTTLKVPISTNLKKREVFLTGQAFFDIKHNKLSPFIVHAGQLNVQVLGTSFDVRRYANETSSKVTVASGMVGVLTSDGKKVYMLLPGKQLIYFNNTGKIITQYTDTVSATGWRQGKLIFNNEPVSDVCRVMENWYDVHIVINNKILAKRRISLHQQNENLITVLQTIANATGCKFTLNGRVVHIY